MGPSGHPPALLSGCHLQPWLQAEHTWHLLLPPPPLPEALGPWSCTAQLGSDNERPMFGVWLFTA